MKHLQFSFLRILALELLVLSTLLEAVAQAVPPDSNSKAQLPIPVATYKLHIGDALKDEFGSPFQWALAPDNSILISFGKTNDNWVVQRITGWETQSPKEQTLAFPFHRPSRYHLFGEPIVGSTGDFVVVYPGSHKKIDASGAVKWEEEIAAIDLRTFQVASLIQRESEFESDSLFFDNSGNLILFGASVTALSLPELKPIAVCSRWGASAQGPSATATSEQGDTARNSCSILMSMAHVSTMTEFVRNRPANQKWGAAAGGPECSREARSKEGNLELDRCGTTHFADSDGVFNTTFWHALRVYSVPDRKTVLSLPLHIYEGTATGLFAKKDGHNYLVVRRRLTLLTYLLPERAN
jgi:hypothetical protein